MNAPITPNVNRATKIKNRVMQGLGALLERKMWSSLLGTTFEGARDLYEVFGWEKSPEFRHFWFKYHRQDIAKRIIDAPTDGIWTDPPTIESDEGFMSKWQDVVAQHSLWATIRTLDVLCGLGKYAVLLVGLDDGQALETPARPRQGRKVIYLQPYAEPSAEIKTYDENPNSPRFGKPETYTISPGDITLGKIPNVSSMVKTSKAITVHHSRLLHVAENTTENAIWGHSRLEHVYNTLDDLLKITGGSAETYWLAGNRGMQIDIDKDMTLGEGDAEDLADEVDEYMHELRRVIRTRGVTIKNLGSDLADPKNPFNVAIAILSGATGIPQRILLGAEAGQLASQQDRANWSDRLNERTKNFAEPKILIPLIKLFVGLGVCPQPQEVSITWPDTFKLNPLERAQTSAQMARSAANLAKVMSTPIADDESGRAEEEEQVEQETPASTGPNGETIPGGTTMVPQKKYKPSHTLVSTDEARTIIGFGKHAPVFDSDDDASATSAQPQAE